MRWLAAWLGLGAACQLCTWLWHRHQRGRFATDVAYDSVTRGNVWILLLGVAFGCLWGPIGPLFLLLPAKPFLNSPEAKRAAERLRGRCHDCGEPLDGHQHSESS
jgi:hypothetical protein